MKKACIIIATRKVLDEVQRALPPGVRVAAKRECFDRNAWELRLEGDGLHELFRTNEGAAYRRAEPVFTGGKLHLA